MRRLIPVAVGAGLAFAFLSGCQSIGPATITRDRFNYADELAQSWKDQLLLNLVKMRYLDLPLFLDVGQIVAGYSLETSGTIGRSVTDGTPVSGDTTSVGGSARFTDRPTITYTPLTGERFLASLLSPLAPDRVFSLVQSGYAADFILELSVDSLNGIRNRAVTLGSDRPGDAEFFRILDLLREIQIAGAMGLRVERPEDGAPAMVMFFRSEQVTAEDATKIAEVRRLLGIAPGASALRLVQSPVRGSETELAVGTRTLMQLLWALAVNVEVPADDLEQNVTMPLGGSPRDREPLLRIASGTDAPDEAFVAVPYQGHWFWIANNDLRSKRTFTALLFMFTVADAGGAEGLPTITIPAQ
jgi:hypothetical protein